MKRLAAVLALGCLVSMPPLAAQQPAPKAGSPAAPAAKPVPLSIVAKDRKGTVVFLSNAYGTVRPDDKSRDLPFNVMNLKPPPPAGTRVLYDVQVDRYGSGYDATNVRVVK